MRYIYLLLISLIFIFGSSLCLISSNTLVGFYSDTATGNEHARILAVRVKSKQQQALPDVAK